VRIYAATDIPTHYHESDPVMLGTFPRESDWQRNVVNTFAPPRGPDMGWEVYHTDDSRRSQTGFPDVIAVHSGAMMGVAAELKTGKKTTVTPDQKRWLLTFAWLPCFETYLWVPSDSTEMFDVIERAHNLALSRR
jgi:Holliday junction resolvase